MDVRGDFKNNWDSETETEDSVKTTSTNNSNFKKTMDYNIFAWVRDMIFAEVRISSKSDIFVLFFF